MLYYNQDIRNEQRFVGQAAILYVLLWLLLSDAMGFIAVHLIHKGIGAALEQGGELYYFSTWELSGFSSGAVRRLGLKPV